MHLRHAALALAITGCAGTWSATDVGIQLGVTALDVVDYTQTVDVTSRCMEVNVVIGKCGGRVSPAAYFVAMAAGSAAVAGALPGRWRTAFQALLIGMEVTATYSNYRNATDTFGGRR